MTATNPDREGELNANSTPTQQRRLVKLLWAAGLIVLIFIGAAVAFGIAGTRIGSPTQAAVIRLT